MLDKLRISAEHQEQDLDLHSSSYQCGEGIRNQVSGKQEGVSQSQFSPGIPFR